MPFNRKFDVFSLRCEQYSWKSESDIEIELSVVDDDSSKAAEGLIAGNFNIQRNTLATTTTISLLHTLL